MGYLFLLVIGRARDRNNLGTAWQSLGEYKKAIDYYEQALETFKQAFGEQHPSTKTVQANLDYVKQLKAQSQKP